MILATNTANLNLKLIQPTDKFADDAFNSVIEDIDNKVVGIGHLTSGAHFEVWTKSTSYQKGDVVRTPYLKSNQYLECLIGGTSGSSCPTDNVQGTRITDNAVTWIIKALGVVDTSTVSIWSSNWDYVRGHMVMYNNCLYRCKTPHISDVSFDLDALKWQEVKTSVRIWSPAVYYYENDTALVDGSLYLCITAHVSESTFNTTEETHWEVIGGAGGISVWQDNKSYNEGQLVSYNNILYKANSKHTSTASFSADIANWDIVNAGLNSWATSVYYPAGMIVIANNKIYQCTTAHTSTTFIADEANWQEISGYRIVIDDWKDITDYVVGDLCAHDKKIYRCTVKHTSGAKFDSIEEANWEELSPTINEITDWKASTSYNAKDIVINDNALYRCKTAHTSTSDFATDALTYWVKLSGANAVSVWASSKSYDEGQLVVYNNQLFRANASHASSATFDLDGAKWNLLESNIGEYKANVYYPIGTAVIYNNALFKCKVAHNSTSTFNRDNWTRIDNNNPLVKDWATSNYYYENDIVLYANQLYRCNTSHTSSNFSLDKTNWTLIRSGEFTFKPNIYYHAGDIVEYSGDIYRAVRDNSSSGFVLPNWEKITYSLEQWKPCYLNNIISMVTFESGEYNPIKFGKFDGLSFTDITGTLSFYASQLNTSDGSVTQTSNAYDGKYGVACSSGGIFDKSSITVVGLSAYRNTKSVTVDFFTNNHSGGFVNPLKFTFFGATISLTGVASGDGLWHHIACTYNSDTDTIDTWVDGTYISNVSASGDSVVFLSGGYYDNIRFTEGKIYESGKAIDIPSKESFYFVEYRYHPFKVGDFAEYDGVLYRCVEQDSDLTFNADKWQQVANIVLTWNPNSYYFAGQLVMDGQTLLRCIEAHTSGADLDNAEYAKWEIIADGKIRIKDWETNKKYYADNVVFSDNILYRCTANHTSGSFTTDLSDGYWVKVSGGSSGGGSGTGNYSQMVAMNVTAPKTYEIKIPETTDFCFPPVEVLKFKAGQTDVVVDALTFDLSDGKLFEVDGISSENSPYALYDNGKLYLNTKYTYKHGSATSCGNGYVTISDDIDLSIFKNVDSVEVI